MESEAHTVSVIDLENDSSLTRFNSLMVQAKSRKLQIKFRTIDMCLFTHNFDTRLNILGVKYALGGIFGVPQSIIELHYQGVEQTDETKLRTYNWGEYGVVEFGLISKDKDENRHWRVQGMRCGGH